MKEFEAEKIIDYFGRIINPKLMPKTSKDPELAQSIKNFNNCLYIYSERKAHKLYVNRLFYVYFDCFLNSDDFFMSLKNNEKLADCIENWVEKSRIILNDFAKVQASITK